MMPVIRRFSFVVALPLVAGAADFVVFFLPWLMSPEKWKSGDAQAATKIALILFLPLGVIVFSLLRRPESLLAKVAAFGVFIAAACTHFLYFHRSTSDPSSGMVVAVSFVSYAVCAVLAAIPLARPAAK